MHQTLTICALIAGTFEVVAANGVAALWLHREWRWRKAKRTAYLSLLTTVGDALAEVGPTLLAMINESTTPAPPSAAHPASRANLVGAVRR